MSGLSTKDVKTDGGGVPKTITPGTHTLKINSVVLKRFPFMEADNGYYFIINVETKPIEGFDGFFINKDDESLGRYAGQIGEVKTNRYYYKDGSTKSGIIINRDMELLKQLKNLCMATESMKWFDAADEKYDTIEAFIDAFNEAAPFKDKFMNFTVAGKEFERKNGYIGYDLFTPKLTRGTVAIEPEDTAISKLIPFNEEKMWEKYQKKAVESFGDDTMTATDIPSVGEFKDAPDFEL